MDRISETDLEWTETAEGDARFRRKHLSDAAADDAAGDPDIGCSLYELPAGGRAWPYHYHTGNAEAIYVLDGEGRVRGPSGDEPIGAGDYVAFPTGEDGGHRVINDGTDPLRYLAVSTMNDPDVLVYPDSGKVGVYAGSPPGGREGRTVHGYFKLDDAVDYWLDEGGDAHSGRDPD